VRIIRAAKLLAVAAGACVLPILTLHAQAPVIADSVTFALIAQTFRLAGDSAPSLRVDPRPLSGDPTLVTFAGLGSVAPPGMSGEVPKSPFSSDTALAGARRRVLERLGLSGTDALADIRCDTRRSPPPQDPGCIPSNGFSTLAIGQPRVGGPYAPGIADDRQAFQGRDVVSVRVIERTVTRERSAEFSADYVYERKPDGSIVFLKRVRLFWIG
jgi:hypothetical protein